MNIKGRIVFNYDNERNAKLAFDSLEVDNENYLKSKLNGNNIEYSLTNDSIGSFLRTADDLISSEIVIEKIVKNTNYNK